MHPYRRHFQDAPLPEVFVMHPYQRSVCDAPLPEVFVMHPYQRSVCDPPLPEVFSACAFSRFRMGVPRSTASIAEVANLSLIRRFLSVSCVSVPLPQPPTHPRPLFATPTFPPAHCGNVILCPCVFF